MFGVGGLLGIHGFGIGVGLATLVGVVAGVIGAGVVLMAFRFLRQAGFDGWVSVHSEAKAKTAGVTSRDLRPIWFPTLDTLCNLFSDVNPEILARMQMILPCEEGGARVR